MGRTCAPSSRPRPPDDQNDQPAEPEPDANHTDDTDEADRTLAWAARAREYAQPLPPTDREIDTQTRPRLRRRHRAGQPRTDPRAQPARPGLLHRPLPRLLGPDLPGRPARRRPHRRPPRPPRVRPRRLDQPRHPPPTPRRHRPRAHRLRAGHHHPQRPRHRPLPRPARPAHHPPTTPDGRWNPRVRRPRQPPRPRPATPARSTSTPPTPPCSTRAPSSTPSAPTSSTTAPPQSSSKAPWTPSPSPSPATGSYVGMAPLGTSLTEEQAAQLAHHAHHQNATPIVATDADLAGQLAAHRDYWLLTQHGLNPRTAALRPGSDPADVLALHGPHALRQVLDNATPLADTLIDERLTNLDRHPRRTTRRHRPCRRPPPHMGTRNRPHRRPHRHPRNRHPQVPGRNRPRMGPRPPHNRQRTSCTTPRRPRPAHGSQPQRQHPRRQRQPPPGCHPQDTAASTEPAAPLNTFALTAPDPTTRTTTPAPRRGSSSAGNASRATVPRRQDTRKECPTSPRWSVTGPDLRGTRKRSPCDYRYGWVFRDTGELGGGRASSTGRRISRDR